MASRRVERGREKGKGLWSMGGRGEIRRKREGRREKGKEKRHRSDKSKLTYWLANNSTSGLIKSLSNN